MVGACLFFNLFVSGWLDMVCWFDMVGACLFFNLFVRGLFVFEFICKGFVEPIFHIFNSVSRLSCLLRLRAWKYSHHSSLQLLVCACSCFNSSFQNQSVYLTKNSDWKNSLTNLQKKKSQPTVGWGGFSPGFGEVRSRLVRPFFHFGKIFWSFFGGHARNRPKNPPQPTLYRFLV